MTSQLKVSESDISSSFEYYDAILQMLSAYGWGAPMSNEHNDSTLSLVEVHALREAVRMLTHSYSQLVADMDYILEWDNTYYETLLEK